MELTEVEFWDNYWADCKLPNTVDMAFSFDRCLANALRDSLADCRGDILEIGCAPGRWLAFLAKEGGLKPSGIEYSEAGLNATKRNFEMLGIEYGRIWSGDFLSIEPSESFDVVMSLGFIEHFDNATEIVGRHLTWLKPGGILVLGIPNFRGIYYPIQAILDRTILEKHNLSIMSKSYFNGLAGRYDLEAKFLDYLGSFEPGLPIVKPGSSNPLQFLVRGLLRISRHIRRFRVLDALNNRFLSSYILAVYQKGLNA